MENNPEKFLATPSYLVVFAEAGSKKLLPGKSVAKLISGKPFFP